MPITTRQPRFALHVFRTAGAAEGGDSVFTSVQELVGTGGLDTHASGGSLWATVAQAGLVDVERWVVGAVLLQVVETVEEVEVSRLGARTGSTTTQFCVTEAANEGSEPVEGVNPIVVDDTDRAVGAEVGIEKGAASSAATSLWEELRSEAFDLVLGKTPGTTHLEGRKAPGLVLVQYPSNVGLNDDHMVLAGENRKPPCESRDSVQNTLARADSSPALLCQYARSSRSNCFDRALMQALSRAGVITSSIAQQYQGTACTVAGAGWAAAATGTVVALESPPKFAGAKSTSTALSVEETLLFAFVNSGLAKNSNLTVSDIVDAVKIRRERETANICTGNPATVSRDTGFTECGRGDSPRDEGLRQEPDVKNARPELLEVLRVASIAQGLREQRLVRQYTDCRFSFVITPRASISFSSARCLYI